MEADFEAEVAQSFNLYIITEQNYVARMTSLTRSELGSRLINFDRDFK